MWKKSLGLILAFAWKDSLKPQKSVRIVSLHPVFYLRTSWIWSRMLATQTWHSVINYWKLNEICRNLLWVIWNYWTSVRTDIPNTNLRMQITYVLRCVGKISQNLQQITTLYCIMLPRECWSSLALSHLHCQTHLIVCVYFSYLKFSLNFNCNTLILSVQLHN